MTICETEVLSVWNSSSRVGALVLYGASALRRSAIF